MRLSLSLCRFAKRIGSKPLALLTFLAVLLSGYSVRAQLSGSEHWIGTWSTAEVGRPQTPPVPAPALPPFQTNQCPPVPAAAPLFVHFNNQTLRQIVHVSIGGSRVRVALSNAYGTAPLTIGSAHVALRNKGASIQQSSDRALTFSGRPTFTIPAGAVLYSDPVTLTVPDMADVAIDLYLPGDTNTSSPLTMHNGAFQTNYVSQTGNHVGMAALFGVGQGRSAQVIHAVHVRPVFQKAPDDFLVTTPCREVEWLHAPISRRQPLADEVQSWLRMATSDFEYRLGTAIGTVFSSIWNRVRAFVQPERQRAMRAVIQAEAGEKLGTEKAHALLAQFDALDVGKTRNAA